MIVHHMENFGIANKGHFLHKAALKIISIMILQEFFIEQIALRSGESHSDKWI